MKSGYRVLMSTHSVQNSRLEAPYWKRTWAVEVPTKVRNFVWRACTGCLPTMVALRSRRVDVASHCPVCRNVPEDTFHALVKCYQAKQVWRLTPVGDIFGVVHSFVDWWRQILKKQNMDVVVQVAMTLWSIWKGRNDLIWKGIVSKANQIIYNAGNFLAQWQYAKLKDQMMGTSVEIEPCLKWSKPGQ